MKLRLIIGAVLLVSSATYSFAQQPQPAQPPEYVLKVSPQELEVLSDGLQTQPFGRVAPLLQKLREQIIAQQPKPATESDKKD